MAIRLQKKISRCSHSTSVHMAPNFCWATAVSSARQHAPATDGACHHECGSLDDAKAKQLKQAKKEREQLSIPNTHRRPYKNQTSIMTIQRLSLSNSPATPAPAAGSAQNCKASAKAKRNACSLAPRDLLQIGGLRGVRKA